MLLFHLSLSKVKKKNKIRRRKQVSAVFIVLV
jgi:hypothetical protein